MDNHLHLIVHVPPVPKEYWLDANEEPAAYAFGMRPPECRVPLWNGDSPSLGSLRIGDSPSPGSDSLVDRWRVLFPDVPARPGRYEDGKIFVYVKTVPTLFLLRPRLRQMAAKLAALPGAPKKVDLRLEIHAT